MVLAAWSERTVMMPIRTMTSDRASSTSAVCQAIWCAWEKRAMVASPLPSVIQMMNADRSAIADRCRFNGAQTLFIDPGSPWQNAWIESFNGRVRDELLNGQLFGSLLEAQVIVEDWRQDYNTRRPHWALRMLTPTAYAQAQAAAGPPPPQHHRTNNRDPVTWLPPRMSGPSRRPTWPCRSRPRTGPANSCQRYSYRDRSRPGHRFRIHHCS